MTSYVVGIAGGSASGKTTFAGALAQSLREGDPALTVEVVGMDRYFYREPGTGPQFVSPTTGETLPNRNQPNSADNTRLVAELRTRQMADDAPDVIILEGLMTLNVEEVRACCDLHLFIELDADERALRRIVRDMGGARGSGDPVWIARYYRECARVGHAQHVEPSRVYADLILRGDSDFARTAPLVATVIREQAVRRNANGAD